MRTMSTTTAVVLALALAGCATDGPPSVPGAADARAASGRPRVLVNKDQNGVALQGYDPVAYFTDGKPTKGSPAHAAKHGGATYYFASHEHHQMFVADPERYTPQFGGYCGYAASINKLSPISPEYWEVLDGRLVLQHNQRAWDAWHKDVPGNLKKADANWPGLVERNARPEKVLVNTDAMGVAVQGYDVVAYFTDGMPVKGTAEHESVYNGARYRFASKEHRDRFEQDPAKYEPQFGGYCAYAASINKVSPINPRYWSIEDGRLLLQHTQEAFDLFYKDAKGNLARADKNWPGLVERRGK